MKNVQDPYTKNYKLLKEINHDLDENTYTHMYILVNYKFKVLNM